MEMVRIHSGQRPTARVADCEFQLISDHGPAADAANGTDPMTTPYPIGIVRRQLPETDRFTGLFSNEGFIGHMPLHRIVWMSTTTRERVNLGAQWTLSKFIASWDVTPQRARRYALAVSAAVLVTLELPGREASEMDVEFVQSGLPAVDRELNLEL
jgi:hypothetical protein